MSAALAKFISELEAEMQTTYFYAGREHELLDLITTPTIDLSRAACAGVDPDVYHPDGPLDEVSAARCSTCPVRMGCLAVALRAEDPQARSGWYGGLGPEDRSGIAQELAVASASQLFGDRAREAVRLRAAGLSVTEIAVRLACSRRTVQRYFRKSKAPNQAGQQ
jgi:DNA-binding CsgD family transcriptional regulator